MEIQTTASRRPFSAALMRWVGFFLLWLALAGLDPLKLPVGVIAALSATWVSFRLLPPGRGSWDFPALAGLAVGFLWQSMVAGVDVAWRAMQPKMPLNPGIVEVRVELPEGPARSAFLALSSLMPGSLPMESDENGIVKVHCLDIRQPVAKEMAAAEKRFVSTRRKS